jgi:hypothetical protein
MDRQAQHLENEQHCITPEPGDYWSEHFCPYLLVLKVVGEKIYVLLGEDRLPAGHDHWNWDVTKHHIIDHATLRKLVTYSTNEAFVADVLPRRCLDFVQEWKEYNISRLHKALAEFL